MELGGLKYVEDGIDMGGVCYVWWSIRQASDGTKRELA